MSVLGFKTGTYAYDANGNMTTDGVRKVTIGYNALNLPVSVTGTGGNTGTATYLYDADGKAVVSTGEYDKGLHSRYSV